MDKIKSFTIDHLRLLRGIYKSRIDVTPSGDILTTFDIRMSEPNRQKALSPLSLHSIEHLAATFLRNHPIWKEKIVYWGPMGCCTGNYLILNGEYESKDIVELMKETMEFISNYDGIIPGASPKDCGNYTFMDLNQAKEDAKKYLEEVLYHLEAENLNYPD